MKKIGYKFLGIVSVGLFMVLSVSAQPGSVTGTKFGRGQDSIDCRRDLSLFAGDYQHKNYKDAIVYWRRLMKNCPQSSPNLIPRGLTMYKDFISKELDPSKKDALVDTLMQVYQIGIETRPNKANLMVNKLQDMERYANETPAQKKRLLTASEEYMNLEKEKSQPRSMVTYMKTSIELNNEGALTDEELLDNYTKVSDVLNAALKKTSDEELAKARDQIDDAFAKSPAANCENLAKIYGPKFETDKNDLEFLSKLTRLLNRNECTDSELFEKAAEQQVALDPSAAAAYNMAKLFFRKGNFEKSLEYFESAIEHEKDPIDKANYYCQMGNVLLDKMQKYTEAKKCALEASKLRPDWGEPYVLLANIYLVGPKCGEEDFQKAQIYWVVVDKLTKAKTVDPEYGERVNQSIRDYTKFFPNKEDAFFYDIKEGTTVTVGCWVNETTKARF